MRPSYERTAAAPSARIRGTGDGISNPRIGARVVAAAFLLSLAAGMLAGTARFDADADLGGPGSVYARLYDSAALLEPRLRAAYRTVAEYGSFRLVEMARSTLASLQARGFRAIEEPYVFSQAINGYVFDVRDGDRVVPDELRAAAGPESRYVVVHFRGPIKGEWAAAIEAAGGVIQDYVPFFSYLVRADAPARAAIAALPFVAWIGEYHPGYKVHPALLGGREPVSVRIVTFSGELGDPVLARLAAGGYDPVDRALGAPGVVDVARVGDRVLVEARIDPSALPALAALPEVVYIEPVRPVQPWNANMQWIVQTNVSSPSPNRRVWNMGITGNGQVVSIADTGLDFDHIMFRQSAGVVQSGDIYNVTDATRRKLVRYWPVGILSSGHTTWPHLGGDTWAIRDSPNTGNGVTNCLSGHGTQVSGTAAGNDDFSGSSANDGSAKGAKIFFQDIGTVRDDPQCFNNPNDALVYLPNDLAELFSVPYDDPAAGVRIHSNSWGSPGAEYDLQARQVDAYMWTHPDALVIFSAGNDGPAAGTVGIPGTNKNGLSVGATNSPSNIGNPNNMLGFSAHGPTLDGRLKPDVTVPGIGASSDSDGVPTTSVGITAENLWGGTSYSAPAAAGAAAMVRQYLVNGWYPTGAPIAQNGFSPSAALLKAMLASSGAQMTCSSLCGAELNTYPNFAQGWGRVLLDDSLYFAGDGRTLWIHDSPSGMFTGDSVTFPIRISASGAALRIVLAWTDYPAAVNANPALVNDLDLTVRDPLGNVYLGNVFGTFSEGESRTGGTADRLNPIEGVLRKAATAGVWTVTVTGANVAFGPQPFAIVAVGSVDTGYGGVALDRAAYGGADTIDITVLDTNAASVAVTLASDSEPVAESVPLAATAPGSGVWRGTIATELGAPRVDGVLQVSDGDRITAAYADAAPSHVETQAATVDARGPFIAAVRAFDITDSAATVEWTTDEPATSWVYYGTGALDHLARLPDLSRTHLATIRDLAGDTLYLYDVISIDRNGARTVDDNGGHHYRFRTAGLADILVVTGDASFLEERAASYRRALAARNWIFNEWPVALKGDPTLATLQQYKAVIWNSGLEQYPPVTAAQRSLLRTYVDGGGRLMFSAHDVAWDSCSAVAGSHTSPEACGWVKGTLHALYENDPPTFGTLVGFANNPVSGSFPSPVRYISHRQGGAGDEIDPLDAGGTALRTWKDGTAATADDVAVLWTSAAANGSATEGCLWCGAPSRVASYFFEFTGIESTTTNSATRADVLDLTLVWLVGRDHPDATVGAPNGGETFTGDTIRISWTRAAHGANVSRQIVQYSADSGQTWNPLASVPGTLSDYIWSVGGLPNGAKYRVRVDIVDDGTPSLTGTDASDADFAINRPGGDLDGPIILPGTLVVDPIPARAGSAIRFEAIADDRPFGAAPLAAAEWFVQDAEPTADQFGSGNPMQPVSPPFDDTPEVIVTTTVASWSIGPQCFWLHAKDAAGNWGPFTLHCFSVVPVVGDVTPPAGATFDRAELSGAGDADVVLTWVRAADDTVVPTPGGTTAYRVMRSTRVDGPYVSVGSRIATGAATYTFVDIGAGADAAAPWYFYRIRSLDAAGNSVESDRIASRVAIPLRPGLNVLSIPLVLADPAIPAVFAGVSLGGVWSFDPCSGGWRSYVPGRPGNALTLVPIGAGLYVNATVAGRLAMAGLLPTTTAVSVCAGWNLVGFPSVSATITAADAERDLGATEVLAADPDAPPGLMAVASAGRLFVPTQAFWIRVAASATWTVPGR